MISTKQICVTKNKSRNLCVLASLGVTLPHPTVAQLRALKSGLLKRYKLCSQRWTSSLEKIEKNSSLQLTKILLFAAEISMTRLGKFACSRLFEFSPFTGIEVERSCLLQVGNRDKISQTNILVAEMKYKLVKTS